MRYFNIEFHGNGLTIGAILFSLLWIDLFSGVASPGDKQCIIKIRCLSPDEYPILTKSIFFFESQQILENIYFYREKYHNCYTLTQIDDLLPLWGGYLV